MRQLSGSRRGRFDGRMEGVRRAFLFALPLTIARVLCCYRRTAPNSAPTGQRWSFEALLSLLWQPTGCRSCCCDFLPCFFLKGGAGSADGANALHESRTPHRPSGRGGVLAFWTAGNLSDQECINACLFEEGC